MSVCVCVGSTNRHADAVSRDTGGAADWLPRPAGHVVTSSAGPPALVASSTNAATPGQVTPTSTSTTTATTPAHSSGESHLHQHYTKQFIMEFITSTKGGSKLVYEGFVYVKQKNLANGVVSYECEMRRNDKQCKAKLKVKGEEVIGKTNEHTHAVSIGRPEALELRQSLKRRALDTEETAQQIITQELENISEQASTHIPAIRTIRRGIRRYRQHAGNPHPVPQTPEEIVIPDEYKVTSRGEDFLLYDGGDDENRILLFSTHRNLQVLETSSHWFCDGTFKVVPSVFYQLFTIHALTADRILPCVYALLPNKQQTTYENLFRQVKALNPELSPTSIMIDFENAIKNALHTVFPDITIQGCFYHLSQAIYRKVQNEGLQVQYQNDVDLNMCIRSMAALAFVPVNDIVESFETFSDNIPEVAQPVVDYFEDTYIGRQQRRGRRNPRFPHTMWSIHERVVNNLPRTNNNVEGWHRHMQANISAYHPNFWHFLIILRREQALNEVAITQMLAGEPAPKQRPKYRAISQRLQTIVADYDNRPILEFLRGIAHNIQM